MTSKTGRETLRDACPGSPPSTHTRRGIGEKRHNASHPTLETATEETTTTMTTNAHQLEHHLDRARARLLALACDLASGGDRARPVPADYVAAGLDSLASLCQVLAAERRGEAPTR